MDIEPESKKYKTDWLNQTGEESLNNPTKINLSTIFKNLYFLTLYLLAISFVFDLIIYLVYYQDKFHVIYYHQEVLVLRYICDILFLFPILIFIKFQKTVNLINYIVGGIVFLPQLVLNIVGLSLIYNQNYCTEEDTLCDTSGFSDEEIVRILTYERITLLRISTLMNFILYICAIALTFLKIYKNY